MFDAPQMKRIDAEMTEREALRTAEAWLSEQDQNERLARMTPRHVEPTAEDWAEGAYNAVLLIACGFLLLLAMQFLW